MQLAIGKPVLHLLVSNSLCSQCWHDWFLGQAVHKVMRMAVLCKQNSDPTHAANLHAVSALPFLGRSHACPPSKMVKSDESLSLRVLVMRLG